MRTPQSLTVTFRPSSVVASLIALWYAATAAIAWTLPWSTFWSVVATIACGVLAVHEMRRTAWRTAASAWRVLRVTEDRSALVRLGDGSLLTGRLCPTTYVGSTMAMLHLRADGTRGLWNTFVVADMLRDDEFRRLKVLLRLSWEPGSREAPEAVASGDPTRDDLAPDEVAPDEVMRDDVVPANQSDAGLSRASTRRPRAGVSPPASRST